MTIELYDGVFKGGGSLGVAYVGAVEYLQRNDKWFQRVAGTSAGAIIAGLIGAGYKAIHDDPHDLEAPGHLGCLKGLLYNSPVERIAHVSPLVSDLRALIPGSVLDQIFALAPGPEIDTTHAKASARAAVQGPPFGGAAFSYVYPTAAGAIPGSTAVGTAAPLPPGLSWYAWSPPAGPTVYLPVADNTTPPPGFAPSAGPPLPAGLSSANITYPALAELVLSNIPDTILPVQTVLIRWMLGKLLDNDPEVPFINMHFRRLFSLLEQFGQYRSDAFRRWYNKTVVDGLIARFPDAEAGQFAGDGFLDGQLPSGVKLGQLTPAQRDGWRPTMRQMYNLTRIHFTCIAAVPPTREMLVMNHEEMPGMPVADAVTMSISAPGYLFAPLPFPGAGLADWEARFNANQRPHLFKAGDPCVDGGVVDNFPMHLFHDPGDDGRVPYVKNAIPDLHRKKIGFYFDDREPNTAPPDSHLPFQLQTLPSPAYDGDVHDPPVPGVAVTPRAWQRYNDVFASARASIEMHWMRALTDTNRTLMVFLPIAPFDWLRFDLLSHEGSEMAARGWVATRETLFKAGWLGSSGQVPPFFTMVNRLPAASPASPTLLLLEDGSVLLGFQAQLARRPSRHGGLQDLEPAGRLFVARVREQLTHDDDPVLAERTLVTAPATEVTGVATRFGPAFVARPAGGFLGAIVDVGAGAPGPSKIVSFFLLDGQAAAARVTDLSHGVPEVTTAHPLSMAVAAGSVWLAWVAPSGKARLGRIDPQADTPAFDRPPLDLTLGGLPLLTTAAVSIAAREISLAIAWTGTDGHVHTGILDPKTGVVDPVADLGPTSGAPTLSVGGCGDPIDPSHARTHAETTRGWVSSGFLLAWVDQAVIRYAALDDGARPVMTARALEEDRRAHTSPAQVGATGTTGKGGATDAYFVWRANDPSNTLYLAKVFGLNKRE